MIYSAFTINTNYQCKYRCNIDL